MNLNALLIRGAVFMVVATILAVTGTRHMPVANAQSRAVVRSAPIAVAGSQQSIVVLPTISVRPSAADLLAADQGDDDNVAGHGALIEAAATNSIYETLTPNMPSLRMDMPYYSFSKALRRGVKE